MPKSASLEQNSKSDGLFQFAEEGFKYANLSASGKVNGDNPCRVAGFYVNSTNAGTLKLWDNNAGSGTVAFNTITPAVGAHIFARPVIFNNACYATIAGTALDVTIIYAPL